MGTYVEILNSDDTRFGGSGVTNGKAEAFECQGYREHGFRQAIEMRLPPLGAVVLKKKKVKKSNPRNKQ